MVKSQTLMANVKFDMTDPETKATVAGWEDGAEYNVTMVSSKAGTATFEEPGVEEEEAAPAEGEAAPPAPGPAAVSAALGSAMGG